MDRGLPPNLVGRHANTLLSRSECPKNPLPDNPRAVNEVGDDIAATEAREGARDLELVERDAEARSATALAEMGRIRLLTVAIAEANELA
jgi:hypothetical protein